jgi:methionine-rich copper-binding protein CopC
MSLNPHVIVSRAFLRRSSLRHSVLRHSVLRQSVLHPSLLRHSLGAGAALLLVALVLALSPAPQQAESAPHLRLVRSAPMADTTVAGAPSEVRLFFSEPPQMRGTTVRLVNAAEALVPTTDAAADPADPKEVFIRPNAPLVPGRYTVQWRVIAADGHTQRGDFAFTVR